MTKRIKDGTLKPSFILYGGKIVKKSIILFMFFLLCMHLFTPTYAQNKDGLLLDQANLKLQSKYVYVYDQTSSQALYKKNSADKIYPASMTKVITSYVALSKIADLNKKVTISAYDVKGWKAYGASLADIKQGETLTFRDLIYGALYPSGADACRALAMNTYGNEAAFVQAMNDVVKELGLTHTQFKNNHGLTDTKHYTTCEDMVRLFDYCLQNEALYQIITSARRYQTSNKAHVWYNSIENTRRLMGIDAPLVSGSKSGYTSAAGRCLVSVSEIHNHRIYICSAKADNPGANVKDHNTITTYLKNKTRLLTLHRQDDVLDRVYVFFSNRLTYDVRYQKDINFLVNSDETNYTITYKGSKVLFAPTAANTPIGNLVVKQGDQTILSETVTIPAIPIYASYALVELAIPTAVLIFAIIFIRKRRSSTV